MKKVSILTLLLGGALIFTACEADRDDNPTLNLTQTQQPISLNTPVFASGTYDLENTDTIQLACTAPAYGFPATVTYVIQVSLDENMNKPNNLATTYSYNKMSVPAKEVAIATTKQMMDKQGKKQDDFPVQTPIYLRIFAYIDGVKGSETYSNVIKLNQVKTKFALPDVEMPEALFVNGKFTGNDWEKAVPTTPVHSNTNTHWRICWVDESGILTSPTKSVANYADDYITTTYSCKTNGFSVDADGKITATTPGWYLMLVTGTVDNEKRTMQLAFDFSEPEVWLIGTSIVNPEVGIFGKDDPDEGIVSNCWDEGALRSEFAEYVKFSVPTEMNGVFVSPPLTSAVDGDGGTRAYVKVKNYEWWKSEMFVFNGKIVYRGAGGDQERVNGAVGKRVYFKFSDDTGKLK
jgi:hypothetical protein